MKVKVLWPNKNDRVLLLTQKCLNYCGNLLDLWRKLKPVHNILLTRLNIINLFFGFNSYQNTLFWRNDLKRHRSLLWNLHTMFRLFFAFFATINFFFSLNLFTEKQNIYYDMIIRVTCVLKLYNYDIIIVTFLHSKN